MTNGSNSWQLSRRSFTNIDSIIKHVRLKCNESGVRPISTTNADINNRPGSTGDHKHNQKWAEGGLRASPEPPNGIHDSEDRRASGLGLQSGSGDLGSSGAVRVHQNSTVSCYTLTPSVSALLGRSPPTVGTSVGLTQERRGIEGRSRPGSIAVVRVLPATSTIHGCVQFVSPGPPKHPPGVPQTFRGAGRLG